MVPNDIDILKKHEECIRIKGLNNYRAITKNKRSANSPKTLNITITNNSGAKEL